MEAVPPRIFGFLLVTEFIEKLLILLFPDITQSFVCE
jgi:hypothetical protein